MAKVIVCRCEDVTLHDVEAALAKGYRDIEEVKRYTGFGTGPCQGKECLREVALAIAARTGAAPQSIAPFTSRPPLTPAPLWLYARLAEETQAPEPDGDTSDAGGEHGDSDLGPAAG
jgi:sarcosine oxidase subunit beta